MTDGQAGPEDTPTGEGTASGAGSDPTAAGSDPTAAGSDPTAAGSDPTAAGKSPTGAGNGPTGAGGPAGTGQKVAPDHADVTKVMSNNQATVEVKRAAMGLYAVLISDVAIAAAAIVGVIIISSDSSSSTAIVSILSSAFTAVGTLTTAYFGIKASANTAKNSIANQQ